MKLTKTITLHHLLQYQSLRVWILKRSTSIYPQESSCHETARLSEVKSRGGRETETTTLLDNANPILDTRVYEVEFPDEHVDEYAANVIAEHMYSQVDSERHHFMIMDEIVDHEKDGSAVAADDQCITVNGRQHSHKTTKGWKFCIQWMDGSTSWEALKDLKESNPVEIAEYAVSNKLLSEPAFSWWVPWLDTEETRSHHCRSEQSISQEDSQVWLKGFIKREGSP